MLGEGALPVEFIYRWGALLCFLGLIYDSTAERG